MRMNKWVLGAALAAGLIGFSSAAKASTVTFIGSSGNLAAQADFTLTGTTLTVTVTNTASVASTDPANTLTGVLFNSSETIGGSFTNIALNAGSILVNSSNNADFGYFNYGNTSASIGHDGDSYGVTSAGVFQQDPNLSLGNGSTSNAIGTPLSPDGPNGGLIPTANAGSYSGGGQNNHVIQNSLVYTITGVSADLSDIISKVNFIYGTAYGEGEFGGTTSGGSSSGSISGGNSPTPLPQTAATGLVLLGGVAGFGLLRKRGMFGQVA